MRDLSKPQRAALTVAVSAMAVSVLAWALRALGGSSIWFAVLVVWLPMTWLGTICRFVHVHLPERLHALRPFERRGRLYEVLGVGVFKRLVRRGPVAVFNPGLHLPEVPTPTQVVALDQAMRTAEASHAILLVASTLVAAHAAARGWWPAAGVTMLVNVLLNGYPVMLQRYNRALLARRFS